MYSLSLNPIHAVAESYSLTACDYVDGVTSASVVDQYIHRHPQAIHTTRHLPVPMNSHIAVLLVASSTDVKRIEKYNILVGSIETYPNIVFQPWTTTPSHSNSNRHKPTRHVKHWSPGQTMISPASP